LFEEGVAAGRPFKDTRLAGVEVDEEEELEVVVEVRFDGILYFGQGFVQTSGRSLKSSKRSLKGM
jgi:hypothetical protein